MQPTQDLSLILYQAELCYKNKNYTKSLNLLNYVLEINPDNYLAYFHKGNIDFEIGEFYDALFNYDKALKINPHYFKALIKKGLAIYQFSIYFEEEKFNEAISCLDKAISLAPGDPEAWYYKGLFIRDHYMLGKYDDDMSHYIMYFEARKCFETTLEIDPDFPIDDEKVFELELAIADEFKNRFYERGLEFQNIGDNDTAIKYFNLVLRFDPGFKKAYDQRIISLSKLKESKKYSKFKFW